MVSSSPSDSPSPGAESTSFDDGFHARLGCDLDVGPIFAFGGIVDVAVYVSLRSSVVSGLGVSKCGNLQLKMGHENELENGHFFKSNEIIEMVQFSKNDHFPFIFDLIL